MSDADSMASAELLPAPAAAHAPRLEVVVPVYNEERILAASVHRLREHLERFVPFSWRIVIADNASTDATAQVAARLASELDGVEVLSLPQKGRGRALRTAWLASDADVVAYMDVDLSTDLRALLPLVAPLISGHSDLAIGTRLARGSRVERGGRREFISRTYNHLLHLTLRARFTDAQCGFKAVRGDVARQLLPEVRDDGWFFDTELLVLAQRAGMRIHEVPVDWVDDPDSRVDVVSTAIGDLRGIARLLVASPLLRFVLVGVASTLAFAVLYVLLRGPLGATSANAIALAITAVGNTLANRAFTFGVRGRAGLERQLSMGFVVYVITVALATGALAVLHALQPDPSRALEVTVLVAASTCATVTRYVALRMWVFAHRPQRQALETPPLAVVPPTADSAPLA